MSIFQSTSQQFEQILEMKETGTKSQWINSNYVDCLVNYVVSVPSLANFPY